MNWWTDAVQPKIEQDLYIDDDFDSFMIVDDDKEAKNNDNIIDIKPKNEQIKNSVEEKIHESAPEDYIDVEKSLNTMIIEVFSGSENEVSYIKTTPSHPRNRLRQKFNKEDEKKKEKREVIVVGDKDDEDSDFNFVRVTPSHPRDDHIEK